MSSSPRGAWERFAARAPYFSVITDSRFLRASLTPEHERVFFASGESLVAWMLGVIDAGLAPQFAPMSTLEYGCGLGRLALESGVPVIPVAMIGTDLVNPPGSKMWRFGRVQVKFGKPMDFSRFEGLAGNRFIERAVIDEVMYELMRLGGQEYVDLYAADIKEGKDGKANIAVKPPARMPEAAAG